MLAWSVNVCRKYECRATLLCLPILKPANQLAASSRRRCLRWSKTKPNRQPLSHSACCFCGWSQTPSLLSRPGRKGPFGLLEFAHTISSKPLGPEVCCPPPPPPPQVRPDASHHADGYEHLFCVKDIWSQLNVSSTYFAWWGKNARSGLFEDYQRRWDLSNRHIIRPDNYKGEQSAVVWPGLKYDACSIAGLLLILGMFAQIRGLSQQTQQRCVSLLRRLLALADFSQGLRLLPDCVLELEEGKVNLTSFLSRFEDGIRDDLEKRPLV